MRRITKLGLTLGVLAVASFLAPGKSRVSLSFSKQSVVWVVCACLLSSLPLPPCACVCVPVRNALWRRTRPQATRGHFLHAAPRFVCVRAWVFSEFEFALLRARHP